MIIELRLLIFHQFIVQNLKARDSIRLETYVTCVRVEKFVLEHLYLIRSKGNEARYDQRYQQSGLNQW